MKEFDGDAYIADRISKALENANARTATYPKPKWWDDDKNGDWQDCISTATSNYGEDNVAFGNLSFAKDFDKYGFRELSKDDVPELGDIIFYHPYGLDGYRHSVMLTGIDDDGHYRVSYGNGFGTYRNNKSDAEWRDGDKTVYRFIGTPAERAEIAEHNARVKEQQKQIYGNEKGEPTSLPSKVEPFPIAEKEAKISKEQLAKTLDFLDHIKKR